MVLGLTQDTGAMNIVIITIMMQINLILCDIHVWDRAHWNFLAKILRPINIKNIFKQRQQSSFLLGTLSTWIGLHSFHNFGEVNCDKCRNENASPLWWRFKWHLAVNAVWKRPQARNYCRTNQPMWKSASKRCQIVRQALNSSQMSFLPRNLAKDCSIE